MTAQQDRERRDQLLDDLKAAVDQWADREAQKTEDEIAFMKSILRGRTGSERLQRANTEQARILVVDDISSFLSGEGA